mmetsp:Transcript_45629/g.108620  ORF Transcript_45629/g.108620 Transcript_45629/m.108620 type:complete len:243 (-) Transcript_45629:774-1502(-)
MSGSTSAWHIRRNHLFAPARFPCCAAALITALKEIRPGSSPASAATWNHRSAAVKLPARAAAPMRWFKVQILGDTPTCIAWAYAPSAARRFPFFPAKPNTSFRVPTGSSRPMLKQAFIHRVAADMLPFEAAARTRCLKEADVGRAPASLAKLKTRSALCKSPFLEAILRMVFTMCMLGLPPVSQDSLSSSSACPSLPARAVASQKICRLLELMVSPSSRAFPMISAAKATLSSTAAASTIAL